MALSSWSNEETFKFIELYQSEPAIWDPKHELHKDKNKVNEAWNRIADSLQIPVSELKKKKETLMAAFRMHFKKKQYSIRSGMGEEEIYKPIWVFYDVMEAFLKGIYKCKSIISTVGESNSLPLEQKAAAIGQLNEQETETPNDTGSNTETKDKRIMIPGQRRRALKPPELEEAEKEMTNAFNTLNQAMIIEDQRKEDDCELYGKLLAIKLRKFSENERQEIMYDIDGLILSRRRNYGPHHVSAPSQIIISKRPSSSATSYSCPSPSSPYLIQRPLSSNSSYKSQDKSQIPSLHTHLYTSPIQTEGFESEYVPSSQIPASGQPSYTQ